MVALQLAFAYCQAVCSTALAVTTLSAIYNARVESCWSSCTERRQAMWVPRPSLFTRSAYPFGTGCCLLTNMLKACWGQGKSTGAPELVTHLNPYTPESLLVCFVQLKIVRLNEWASALMRHVVDDEGAACKLHLAVVTVVSLQERDTSNEDCDIQRTCTTT